MIRSGDTIYNGRVTLTVFDTKWKQLSTRNVRGTYQLNLAPGTYRIQLTDARPTYDKNRFAPVDLTQRVTARTTVRRDVRMKRGASITGTVKTNGRIAPNARVVAANQYGVSLETRANSRGQFAIGGLPSANYSVYTWDARKQWADTSYWLPNRRAGANANITINLKRRAGQLVVNVTADKQRISASGTVTARNKRTGQWYTARAVRGTVTFAGVMPGPYEITVPDMGAWFGRTGTVASGRSVPAGDAIFTDFALTKRGGSVTGTIVDARLPGRGLRGVRVRIYTSAGALAGTTTTATNGTFRIDAALRTGSGYKILADIDGTSGWIRSGPGSNDQCRYSNRRSAAFKVTQGKVTALGRFALTARESTLNPYCFDQPGTTPTPTTPSPTTAPTTEPSPTAPSPTAPTTEPTPDPTAPSTQPTGEPSTQPSSSATSDPTSTP